MIQLLKKCLPVFLAAAVTMACAAGNLPARAASADTEAQESADAVAETAAAEEAQESAATEAAPVTQDYELNGPDIYGETYCVIDGNTGEILFSKDPDKKMYPASCTKIMTALLVLENVEDLDQTLTFTETAVNIDPSSSTLPPKAMVGEVMTVRDALYGMLLQSANECGAMLGEYVAGSEAAFADMMNAKAAELGLTGTHFMNAYGIHDENHYTTAHDLALILRAAMQNERYRELNATVTYTIPATNMCAARTITMGHKMINGQIEEPGVIGGKTGSTPQAGRCLATACDRDGMYVITTVMKSTVDYYYQDTQVLLEYTYGILNDHTMAPLDWVETNDAVVPTENVRIRYSPSTLGAVFGMASPDQQYVRRAIYGDWSMVECDGKLLYVMSDYLSSLEPEKVPETTEWFYQEPTETETEESTTESVSAEETAASSESLSSADETDAEKTDETRATESAEAKEKRKKLIERLLVIVPAALAGVLLLVWILALVGHVKRNRRRRRRRHGKR